MRTLLLSTILCSLGACAGRIPFGTVDQLELETVVLYRNGVGYFERRGEFEGDILRLRVRKDQVNDLLKSLTVVDAKGQAVSISMPLDPQTWANAALATLAPGRGSLAEVLDALRGAEITVRTGGGQLRGRIVMIERSVNEPDPSGIATARFVAPVPSAESIDYKLTLMHGDRLDVIRLSKIQSISLRDGDLAMQLHRSLDASAGEGMFEQVEIEIRLQGERSHDLMVSYVVGAPMWKPTYRVVLPEKGKSPKALLQGWAVVDNTSGEDWSDISLSLTSGAPIAFQYDLHTPREVGRTDLTESGVHKQAQVSLGETSYDSEPMAAPAPPAAEAPTDESAMREEEYYAGDYDKADDMAESKASRTRAPNKKGKSRASADEMGGLGLQGSGMGGGGMGSGSIGVGSIGTGSGYGRGAGASASPAPAGPGLDYEALKRSTMASARSKQVTGLTRIDLQSRVTVPDGTSTMVALVNDEVNAEETFLFKPGGAGSGYENNPYRVVRFKNSTDYVLEPGPISIYSGGSFVGEGLSEAVGSKASVTIPFAVEPAIMVTSSSQYRGEEMRLLRIVRGVLEVESFYQTITTWDVRGRPEGDDGKEAIRVLVRQPRQGTEYTLAERPEGTEDLDGAYLIPVPMAATEREGHMKVIEQTPSRTTLTIWDGRAIDLLDQLIHMPEVDSATRAKLQPIVDLRREIGRIDTEISGLEQQQVELDQRAEETRENLRAIRKDGRAGELRSRLNKRLEEFSASAAKMGRQIVDLASKRLEKKIELEDKLQDFELRAPTPEAKGAKPSKDKAAKPAKP